MLLATMHMRLICSCRLHIAGDLLMHGYLTVDPRAVFTVLVRRSESEGIAPNGCQNNR